MKPYLFSEFKPTIYHSIMSHEFIPLPNNFIQPGIFNHVSGCASEAIANSPDIYLVINIRQHTTAMNHLLADFALKSMSSKLAYQENTQLLAPRRLSIS